MTHCQSQVKIIPPGNYVEINSTRVIPSPRESDRVPFGTGASIRRWTNGGQEALHTYPLEPFTDLKHLFDLAPVLFRADPETVEKCCSSLSFPLRAYLEQNDHIRNIGQASANSASSETFLKRFFAWFDGLKTIKYLNDSCRRDHARQPVCTAAARLLRQLGCDNGPAPKELLRIYRAVERGTHR